MHIVLLNDGRLPSADAQAALDRVAAAIRTEYPGTRLLVMAFTFQLVSYAQKLLTGLEKVTSSSELHQLTRRLDAAVLQQLSLPRGAAERIVQDCHDYEGPFSIAPQTTAIVIAGGRVVQELTMFITGRRWGSEGVPLMCSVDTLTRASTSMISG